MKKIYYARPINIYGTKIDEQNKQVLVDLGFDVIDPNKKELESQYTKIGMQAYYKVISECNALAFFTTAEGSITSGVFKEILFAKESNLPVLEIPNLTFKSILTVDETRAYLSNVGFR